MKKPFYKSMTFYGALLLGVETALLLLQGDYAVLKPVVGFLGTFLTAFGFRRAMK